MPPVARGQRHWRQMDETGDGTGTTVFTGNYSGGALTFALVNDAVNTFLVHTVIHYVKDEGAGGAWRSNKYSNQISGLGRWIGWVEANQAGTPKYDLTPNPIAKRQREWVNGGWERMSQAFGAAANKDEWLIFRLRMKEPLRIRPPRRLQVFLNNDFTLLSDHRFAAEISYE